MRILYFAWLRERVGAGREDVDAGGARTVAELIEALKARDARYAAAFADLSAIRVALDHEQAELDAPLEGVAEVAFFPPVTGG